ncbi:MAG: hypothetical protein EAY70_03025 [Sphingomonadales bacterium]|nr:MAG: hypothetical protein EAY70_03025 [Sphingomonadales bacterium]
MAEGFQIVAVERRWLDQLDRLDPPFPHDLFTIALSRFMSDAREPAPRAARDQLDEIADGAGTLAAAIAGASPAAQEAMALRAHMHGADELRASIGEALRTLMGIAEMARRDIEPAVSKGSPMSKNTRLVADLAKVIRAQGGNADARPQGPLVLAFGIALSAAGKLVADPAATVRSALATLGKQ